MKSCFPASDQFTFNLAQVCSDYNKKMKVLLFGAYLLLYFSTCKSSKCVEKIFTPQNIFPGFNLRPQRNRAMLQQIICSNVSADLVLDFNYEVKPSRQELVIRDSLIPKLPTNSSLSRFTHIKTLRIANVSLELIEPGAFSGLVQLLELSLNDNNLTKISNGVFNNLKTLNTLYLFANKISEIEEGSFSGLDELTNLHLYENKLISLSENFFTDLKNLEQLWISENPLTELSVSDLPTLNSIVASGTNLKTLNLNLRKSPLQLIKFVQGRIEEIDFSQFSALEVHFENNEIKVVHNWDLLKAKEVFLHHNQITQFDISENVDKLDLSHNHIETIGNTFLGRSKNLTELNLAFNKIPEVASDQLRGLTELEILNLDHNEIGLLQEKTFVNSPRIRKLFLAHNKIQTIAPNSFIGLFNLDHLDLSGNDLKKLESPVLSELKITNVVVGNTEIDWEYVKTLINGSDDLSFELDPQFWTCGYLGNDNENRIKYVTKRNVENVGCHFKKK